MVIKRNGIRKSDAGGTGLAGESGTIDGGRIGTSRKTRAASPLTRRSGTGTGSRDTPRTCVSPGDDDAARGTTTLLSPLTTLLMRHEIAFSPSCPRIVWYSSV